MNHFMINLTEYYSLLLTVMSLLAVFVFFVLFFVDAGYGMMTSPKWGKTMSNRWGWMLMELPVFISMAALWWHSDRTWQPVPLCFFLFFQIHYLQRSILFPLLLKGNSRMPLIIIFLGIVFNLCNALMQGGWIFYVAPDNYYDASWFTSLPFLLGTFLFMTGMYVNIQSDAIIRNLRAPGDRSHYIPRGGMFKYVTSANYLGELLEWTGFAILTWSVSGAVFVLWTFANLAPRANSIHKKYERMFSDEYKKLNRKRILPFIY